MKKYSYILKNLECSNCANKIQIAITKEKGFKNVVVNFNTQKLIFETDREDRKEIIINIAKKIEPSIVVETESTKMETEDKKSNWLPVIRLVLGVIFGVLGCYVTMAWKFNLIFTILAYGILLYRTSKNAVKMLIKNKTINENFLITISSIGAYLVGEHMEGLMVITLYEIGKILEERAVNKTRKSIKDLMNIKPEYANLKNEEGYKQVAPEEVKVGDIIIIKQGEKIPLDGRVISGKAKIDTSSLTGEAVLREVEAESEVLSGSINAEGLIEVEVTSEYANSTVNKILELVENATDKKAKTETFVAKAARVYTPVVFGLAILVAVFMPLVMKNVTYSESIYRALIFLVISCPCAIAISVPLSYFSGIGKASKKGILIKGSDYLDELKDVKEIIFDKTGTLTYGSFNVSEINSFNEKYLEKDVLDLIAKGENFSNHPIAKSILKKLEYELDVSEVRGYKEISGKGIEYNYGNSNIKIGNGSFVGLSAIEENKNATIIYLKKDNEIIGNIVIKDEIKKESKEVILKLNKLGIKARMFTGDNKKVAEKIAEEIGIKEYKYEMLPEDKYREVEKVIESYKGTNTKVCFIGDGINDSPVLAMSDIGISMGGVGQEAAIEASDIVIMTDNLNKIIEGINISKKTVNIIKQNLIFAIGTKVLILLLSSLGFAGMWQAIFADVGVTLITILNTLRILNK